jgi:hypothetical protein
MVGQETHLPHNFMFNVFLTAIFFSPRDPSFSLIPSLF